MEIWPESFIFHLSFSLLTTYSYLLCNPYLGRRGEVWLSVIIVRKHPATPLGGALPVSCRKPLHISSARTCKVATISDVLSSMDRLVDGLIDLYGDASSMIHLSPADFGDESSEM